MSEAIEDADPKIANFSNLQQWETSPSCEVSKLLRQ